MASDTKAKPPLRERVVGELQELLVLTIYLFIVIWAMNAMKAAVLRSHGVEFVFWGVAIVKALLLAKFVMLGRALKLGGHNTHRPLIWPMLRKTFTFLMLLIVLTIVEEVVVGLFHHRSIGESLGELFGQRLLETLAGALLLLLVLVPYFAFQVVAEALGEGRLVRMLLVDRNATGKG